MFCLLAPFMAV